MASVWPSKKFGAINDKGYLVSPPLRSPGSLWEGSFGTGSLFGVNQKFTLYLSESQHGRLARDDLSKTG